MSNKYQSLSKTILVVINNYQDVSHNQHLLRLLKFLTIEKKCKISLFVLSNKGPLKSKFQRYSHIKIDSYTNFFLFLKRNKKILFISKELRSEYFIFFCRFITGWNNHTHLTIRPSFGFLNESIWKIIKNILFYFSLLIVDENIAVGKTVERKIKQNHFFGKKASTAYIPNSVSNDFLMQVNKKYSFKDLKFLYTGFLEKRKNLFLTLSILDSLNESFSFMILGDGPNKKKLINQTKTMSLNKKVKFIGHVKNIRPFFLKSNAFIFLSKMEGLSLSLLEAMGAGLVCFASDIPENRELIVNKKNGFLIPLNNPKLAIKSFKSAIDNKHNYIEISNQAKETIKQSFCDEVTFPKYYRLITDKQKNYN